MFTIERLRKIGSSINQRLEILPNTEEEAQKRAKIAVVLALIGGVSGVATTYAGEANPELARLTALNLILLGGGTIDMITVMLRENELNEKNFKTALRERKKQLQEKIAELSPNEVESRLGALRGLWNAVEELGATPPHPKGMSRAERTARMVIEAHEEVYETQSRSEGL